MRKQLQNLEKKISELDTQKHAVNAQLLESTDPDEALQLHEQLATISSDLSALEDRWCELQEQLP